MLAYLNDPRVRSIVAGALGGLVGWMVAEVVVLAFGGRLPLVGTVLVGVIVGTGIGVALSGAEGLLIGSKTALRRGVTAGLIAGIVGGLVGSLFSQGVYALAGGGTTEGTAGTDGDAPAGPSVFSTSLRQRLEKAGARVGEVEVALSWENHNDLDLWVTDPEGKLINWQRRLSPSGGELDVDRNAGCSRDVTNEPVEHVVWDREPPLGRYRVQVDHFRNCGPNDPTPFVVAIKLGDELLGPYKGRISSGEPPVEVATFEVGGEDQKPVAAAEPAGPSLGALLLRMLGWLVFGALLGCAEGLRRRSTTALRNAVIGGAIGGAVGGLLFEVVAWMNLGDVVSRLLGFVVLGACIGLWIVIIERALSAVLAVRSGRYEGRMIFLDRPEMRIGRDDVLEVYLGGDPTIAAHHATVRVQSGTHQIVPVDGAVTVNAEPITGPHTLRDKDAVTIGNTRLGYSSRTAAEAGTPPPGGMQGPVKQAPPPPPRPGSPGGPAATSPKPTAATTRPPVPPPAGPERPSRLPPPPPPPKRP